MDVSLTKVKCYLTNSLGDPSKDEIRLFRLDLSSASCYTELVKHLTTCYGGSGPVKFSFVWRDEEDEEITVSSNEELLLAGEECQGVLKIYATVTANPTSSADEAPACPRRRKAAPGCGKGKCVLKKILSKLHIGVVCDGCDGPIKGPRFKCAVCPDFDLCKVCRRKGTHKEHEFYRIAPPRETCPDPTFGNLWSLYNSNQAPQPFPSPPPQYSEQATETTASLIVPRVAPMLPPPPEDRFFKQNPVVPLTQRFSDNMNDGDIPAEEARSEGSFVNIAEPDDHYYDGLTFDVDDVSVENDVEKISLIHKAEKDESSTDGDFDLLREEFSAEKLAEFRMPEGEAEFRMPENMREVPEQDLVYPKLLSDLMMPTERLISFTEISAVPQPEEPAMEEPTLLSLTQAEQSLSYEREPMSYNPEQSLSYEPEPHSLYPEQMPAEVPYHVQMPESLSPRRQSPIPSYALESRPYQREEEPLSYSLTSASNYNPTPTTAPLPPHIQESLTQMIEMGYTNNGGWLGKLLLAKKGDVSEVIDILHTRDMAKRT